LKFERSLTAVAFDGPLVTTVVSRQRYAKNSLRAKNSLTLKGAAGTRALQQTLEYACDQLLLGTTSDSSNSISIIASLVEFWDFSQYLYIWALY